MRLTDERNDRIVYFDYLRILATFAVIIIHCLASGSADATAFDETVFGWYGGLSQWAVPVFVMVSGALFFGRDISLGGLFKKNILRIGTAFLFWSVLYACWRLFVTHEKHGAREFVTSVVKGHFHMWFLFLIVGLYLIVPFLNKIVEDRRLEVYFVVLAFLFSFLFPQAVGLLGLKYSGPAQLFGDFISKLRLEFVLGYSGYFVLGHVIAKSKINKKVELPIYALGLCGAALTVAGNVWFARIDPAVNAVLDDELTVNSFFFTLAVFVFAKQHLNRPCRSKKAQRTLAFLSKCTFGVYLVHPLVIDFLKRFLGFNSLLFNPIIAVPVMAAAVAAVSAALSAAINKIPVVKKWIV